MITPNIFSSVFDIVMAARPAAGNEISGVLLNFERGTIVATNGNVLLERKVNFPQEMSGWASRIAHPDLFRSMRMLPAAQIQLAKLQFLPASIVLIDEQIRMEFQDLPGTYPKYESAYPAPKTAHTIRLNLNLLMIVQQALKLQGSEGVTLTLDPTNHLAGIQIDCRRERVGALMPMRLETV